MDAKADAPIDALDETALSPLLAACLRSSHLKAMPRRGWLRVGIGRDLCESVADHSWNLSFLAMAVLAGDDRGLDVGRVVQLAVIHDLGEALVGDVTPMDGVEKAQKHADEKAAVELIAGRLPGGAGLLGLFREAQEGRTPESRFVKELDRLEAAIQGLVHHVRGEGEPLELVDWADDCVTDETLRPLVDEIVQLTKRVAQPSR